MLEVAMRRLLCLVCFVALAVFSTACDNFLRSVVSGTSGCSVEEIGITSPSTNQLSFVGAEPLCVYKPLFPNDFLGGVYFKSALLAETSPARGTKLIITDADGRFRLKYRMAVSMSGAPEGTSDAVVSVWTSPDGYSLGDEIGSAIVHNGETVVITNSRQVYINRRFVDSLIVKAVYERGPISWETTRVLVEARSEFSVKIG